MPIATPDAVEAALQSAHNETLLDWWGEHAPDNLQRVADEINDFVTAYRQRCGEEVNPFALLDQNPARAAAFFQLDTFLLSTEMKIAVYRILLGCEIIGVRFDYEIDRRNSIEISLRTPDGEQEIYVGQGPQDFKILRHLGSTMIGNTLRLEGYYAIRR